MEAELQREGWYMSEKGLQHCRDLCSNRSPTAKEIIANALHTDIRQIGKQILPADINKGKDSEINGPIVLQIQKVRNVSAPTTKEDSSFAPRMLKFTLTDGVITCSGIEIEIIHSVSLTSPPGSKIKLVGTIKIQHGFLLLNSYSLKFLGGDVEQLKTKWEISQNVSKIQRKVLTAEGGPPLFVPFEESDFAKQRPTKAAPITKKEPNFKAPPKGNVQTTKTEKATKPFEEKKIWKSEPLKTKRDKNPTSGREDREEKIEAKKIIEGPKTDQQNKTTEKKKIEQRDQKSQARWKDKDTKETEKEKRQSRDDQRNDRKEFKNDFTRAEKKEFKKDGDKFEKRETVKEHRRDEKREFKKDETRFEKREGVKEYPKNDKRVDKRESNKEYTRNGRNGQRNDFPKIENKGHKEYQRNERKNPGNESTKSWKNESDAKGFLRNPKKPEAEVDRAAKNVIINDKQSRDDFQNTSGGARMRSDKQEFKNQHQHKSGLPPRLERLRHNRKDDFEPVGKKTENAVGKFETSGAKNKDIEGMRADLVKKAEEVASSGRVPAANAPAANVPVANVPAANVPAANVPAANVPASNVPAANVPSRNVPSGSVPPDKKKSEDLLDKDMEQVLVLLNEKMRIDGGNKSRGEERRSGRQRNENTRQSGGRFGGRQGEWQNENDRGMKEILKSGVQREKPTDRHDGGQKARYSEKRNAKFDKSKGRTPDEGNVHGEKDGTQGRRENFSSMNVEIIKREEKISVQLQQHTKTAWTNEDVAPERNDDRVFKDDENKQPDKVAQFMSAVVTANRSRSTAGGEYQPDSPTLPQTMMRPQAITQTTIQQPMITSSGPLMYSYLPTYPSAMYQQNATQIYQTAPSQAYQTTLSQAYQSTPSQGYQSAQSQAYLSTQSQGYPSTQAYQSTPAQAYQRISSQEYQQMLPQGYNAQIQQVPRYQQAPSSTMYLQQNYGLQNPGNQSLNYQNAHFPAFAPQDQHRARVKHDIYRPPKN
eukprot:Seg3865.2 transcript_id=Seg3865.2/GoldUCD/mRNA.D3Y31 product="Tudor domain-containing protein 3" protein_id=Seg3865.2/GoldUCD/D3Y31